MKILGHRGARFEKPENTMLGFNFALKQRMQGIELDVRSTKDQQLVVIHDESIDRTSNSSGNVSEFTYKELCSFDFGEGETISLLSEVIPVICPKAILFIELKDNSGREVAKLVESSKFKDQCIIKSFDHRQLKDISKLNADLKLAALMVCTPNNPKEIAFDCGASILSLNISYIDQDFIKSAHESDIEVCGWNCNDIQKAQNLKNIGLDWMGTDNPSIFASNCF